MISKREITIAQQTEYVLKEPLLKLYEANYQNNILRLAKNITSNASHVVCPGVCPVTIMQEICNSKVLESWTSKSQLIIKLNQDPKFRIEEHSRALLLSLFYCLLFVMCRMFVLLLIFVFAIGACCATRQISVQAEKLCIVKKSVSCHIYLSNISKVQANSQINFIKLLYVKIKSIFTLTLSVYSKVYVGLR